MVDIDEMKMEYYVLNVDFKGEVDILGIELSARDLYGYEELFKEVEAIQEARNMEWIL